LKFSKIQSEPRGRRDLRKIKRDKEEKRQKRGATDAAAAASPAASPAPASASQPLLTRLFGSRRSGRNGKAKTKTAPASAKGVATPTQPASLPQAALIAAGTADYGAPFSFMMTLVSCSFDLLIQH